MIVLKNVIDVLPFSSFDVRINNKGTKMKWKVQASENEDAMYHQLRYSKNHMEWMAMGPDVHTMIGGQYGKDILTEEDFKEAIDNYEGDMSDWH